jgi:hypothetical protein
VGVTDNAAGRPRGAHPSAGHGWPDTGYRSSRSGPLCWGQQWHWFDDTVPEERRLFTLPVADHCEIPAGASSADVHAALRIMARRHEILRTTVSRIHPRQVVHDDDELGWDVAEVAVDRLDATTLQEVEDRLIEAAIDIERTRLWRARIVTTARIPRFLVVVTHHVALDGWGLGVLLDEVHGLLAARETPPVPDSIAGHHPLDQAAAETGLDDQPAVDRWVQLLADNPVNVLAPYRGHGETGGHHATMYRSRRALADAVAIARDHATSTEMVLYTAMVHLIASRTGCYRFLAAVVVSNRPRAALRRSLGVYALPVPVQVDAEPRWSFTNLLSQASTACLRAYRHSHYSPDHLTMALARQAAERGLLGAPVLEVSFFSWARPYVAPDAVMPIATDTVWARTRPQPCDGLFVDAGNDGDYLRVDLTVGDHLLGRADAEAFPLQLCELLAAVRAGKFCRLPEQARTAVGAQWSQVREGRVRTSDVEVVLRSHPAVHDATVVAGDNGPGRGVLVAHVCVNIGSTTPTADPAPTVDPAELRRHIVDRLPDHPGVIAPHRFVMRRTGTATAAHDEIPQQCLALDEGTGRDLDPIPARGDTEQVLADAVQRVCGATIDLARSYGDHGGTLLAIPALLAGLASAGYGGLCADDLTGPASLAHLATHLSRTDPTTGPAASGAHPPIVRGRGEL